MKILVTGGAGFLGSSLAAELQKRGHHVTALIKRRDAATALSGLNVEIFICNLLDREKLEQAVQGIDVIFHVAAIYKRYPFYTAYPKEIYDINVEGTRNVFEAAFKAGVKKIIYTSSIATIGKKEDETPADESIRFNSIDKRSHYGKSKAAAEEMALSYHRKGMHVVIINPGFLFGVRDSRPTPIGKMVINFLNRAYPCYFDALLCISDLSTVVEAHIKAMEIGKSGERYIIAYERHYTLKEIFDLLENISGIKRPRIKLPLSLLYILAIVNEFLLGIFGLGNKVKPLVASETIKGFMLKTTYNGMKARKEFSLRDKPFMGTLESIVKWYVLNGYIQQSSKIIYFRKIGKIKR